MAAPPFSAPAPPGRIEELREALRQLSPRSVQALTYRLLEGLDEEACAHRFGILRPAFQVMLLRGAAELCCTLAPRGPHRPAWSRPRTDDEAHRARLLSEALEGHSLPADPAVRELLSALLEVRTHGAVIRARNEEEARRLADSPAHRRETVIRRILIVAIILVTAVIYGRSEWQKRRGDRLEPRAPPTVQEPGKKEK